MLRRASVALVLSALAVGALAGTASADPVKAKTALVFPASCAGQTVQVAVNGNGKFTPAHVLDSTAVFIPQAFNLTFQFTPPGGPTHSETDIASKHHAHGDLVTCSVNVTRTTPDGTFHFFGTATGFFTPVS